jgi:hypothetical protein
MKTLYTILALLVTTSAYAANPSFADLTNGSVHQLVITNSSGAPVTNRFGGQLDVNLFPGQVIITNYTGAPIVNQFGAEQDINLFPGEIQSTNQLNGWLNVRAHGVQGGATVDTTAVQTAINNAQSGSVIYFPPHPSGYYTFTSIVVTQSNITIDGGGNYFTNTTLGQELFSVMPHSLSISNRIVGSNMPPAWYNAGVPCYVDGDPLTMMHESNQSLRLTNITFRNFRSMRDGNLIRAYSVDGFIMHNVTANAPSNSVLRIAHSSNIDIHQCDLTGGASSYLIFAFKCRKANVYANLFHSTGFRTLSFKGALHAPGIDIFSPSTNYVDGLIDVHNNTTTMDWDGYFLDWPPDYNDDAGDACGLSIGFTKGDWYGRLDGASFHHNLVMKQQANVAGNGRAFWFSYPHKNISVENNVIFDGGIFMAGVDGAKINENFTKNSTNSANLVFIQEEGAHVAQNISVNGNIHRSVYPATTGGGTDPQPYYLEGQKFVVTNNKFEIGYTNVPNLMVTGPTMDRSFIVMNRAWANSTNVILPNMVLSTFGGTNNTHGITSDNTCFDVATDAVKTSGVVMFDNGAGSGLQIRQKNGYAGIGFMATNGVDYLSQIYQDPNTNFVFYNNTAPRIIIQRDGSTYIDQYIELFETTDPSTPTTNRVRFYTKDNGSGTSKMYFRDSVGTITELGAGGGGGTVTNTITLGDTPDWLPSSSYARPDTGQNIYRLLFAQNEYAIWQFRMPDTYSSGLSAKLNWSMASATAGSVTWSVEVFALSPGDAADANTPSFDTANTGTTAVPGTAGYVGTTSISLANADSVAAGDFVQIKLTRTDAVSGDAELLGGPTIYFTKP